MASPAIDTITRLQATGITITKALEFCELVSPGVETWVYVISEMSDSSGIGTGMF
jgi:hypothetical protein